MHRYRAFGLNIESELPLDELSVGSSADGVDLTIIIGETRPSADPMSDEAEVVFGADRARMTFAGVGQFELDRRAGSIVVSPLGSRSIEALPSLIALPLLGSVMAVWLHLGGALVLHASAVAWRGRVIAFIGDKGAGKSTTAAALLTQGAMLMSDDLVRVWSDPEGAIMCAPAMAQMKLTEETANRLAPPNGRPLASPHPDFAKQRWRLEDRDQQALPLRLLCTLEREDDLRLEPLGAPQAFAACLEQVFVRRYGASAVAGAAGRRVFADVADLVGRTPCRRLILPSALQELVDCAPRLLAQLEAIGS